MDLLNLIQSRKSVRKYSDKHIPDADLKKVLEAGRLAPSWMNVQCWKFILVKSQENKDLLSELSLGQTQVKNADAVIVCVADTQAWEEAKITHIQKPALNPALQCEKGVLIRSLEQVIYTGILPEVYAKVKEKLNLNENQIISTMITLGYETESTPTVKTRKDFDEVVSFEKIGCKF